MRHVQKGVIGIEKIDRFGTGHRSAGGGQAPPQSENLRFRFAAARRQHAPQGSGPGERSASEATDQAVSNQPTSCLQRIGTDHFCAVTKQGLNQRALGKWRTRSAMISRWISELPAAIVSTQDHMKS